MKRNLLLAYVTILGMGVTASLAAGQQAAEPAQAPPTTQPSAAPQPTDAAAEPQPPAEAAASPAAEKAKAAFEEKFAAYRDTIREIEKLQAQYQTADDATRKKINADLTAIIANAQGQVNEMVDAAIAAYQAAPNTDPRITDLLISVARHYAIGRQSAPPETMPGGNPDDAFYRIEGGDQYEKALPLVTLLMEHNAEHKELPAWAFLCAFMTNDYDAARRYLEQAQNSGAFQAIGEAASKSDKEEQQAGLMRQVAHLIDTCASNLDNYAELWKREAELREAEAKADDLPRVKLTTSKGEIVLELFENQAPQSVANFVTLTKQGFYNGTPFHRVLPKFMAQGGDPTGTGTGGPGYSIRGEASRPGHRSHFRGTLSMAHSGHPDSGGSQFFLTFVATPHLNGRHTAFGRVIEGMEVLAELQRRSAQHQQNPPEPDRILKAEVLRDRGHEYAFEKLPDR